MLLYNKIYQNYQNWDYSLLRITHEQRLGSMYKTNNNDK